MQMPVMVHPMATVIGDVTLGPRVSIWPGAVLRGDEHGIVIGEYSNIQDNCVVHVVADQGVWIGSHVTVGHGAILHACTVEDEALIGMGAIVLDGAVVGKGAILGAGALVPPGMRIEPGMLYVGVPAKQVRPVKPEEAAQNITAPEEYWHLAEAIGKEPEESSVDG